MDEGDKSLARRGDTINAEHRKGQLKTEQFLAGGYNLVTEKQEG
jgi:hypothetical protein